MRCCQWLGLMMLVCGGLGSEALWLATRAQPLPSWVLPVRTAPAPQWGASPTATTAPLPRVDATTIAPTGLTLPSLWWSRDRLTARYGADFILNWQVMTSPLAHPPVDVLMNGTRWRSLSPIEQYAVLNQLGVATHRDGYNVRLYDAQTQFLGGYFCVTARLTQPSPVYQDDGLTPQHAAPVVAPFTDGMSDRSAPRPTGSETGSDSTHFRAWPTAQRIEPGLNLGLDALPLPLPLRPEPDCVTIWP